MMKGSSDHTKRSLSLVVVLIALWLPAGVHALSVEGLYEAEIPVEGQSEAERNRAYREGLAQVLVKASGQPGVLQHPRVRSAMSDAAGYVEEVSYRTALTTPIPEPGEPMPAPVQQAFLTLRLSEDAVEALLLDTDSGVWDRNRPAVLLWLVVQEVSGQRRLLSSDSGHPALSVVNQFSRERAVPFQIPLLDLTDRRALSVEQVWGLDEEAIREASARYGASTILAGRMLETADGGYVGAWQFHFRDQTETFNHIDTEVTPFMEHPLDQATVRMAEYFALSREDLDQEERLEVRIDNVGSLQAHASVLRYVRSLSVVNGVHVSQLDGDRLDMTLRVAGGARRLGEFIRLDRDLEQAGDDDGEPSLHYRWTR
ncbi:MAG: DUF2066 domain-containing protein [Pseudohongiellaceae bacterium]